MKDLLCFLLAEWSSSCSQYIKQYDASVSTPGGPWYLIPRLKPPAIDPTVPCPAKGTRFRFVITPKKIPSTIANSSITSLHLYYPAPSLLRPSTSLSGLEFSLPALQLALSLVLSPVLFPFVAPAKSRVIRRPVACAAEPTKAALKNLGLVRVTTLIPSSWLRERPLAWQL